MRPSFLSAVLAITAMSGPMPSFDSFHVRRASSRRVSVRGGGCGCGTCGRLVPLGRVIQINGKTVCDGCAKADAEARP